VSIHAVWSVVISAAAMCLLNATSSVAGDIAVTLERLCAYAEPPSVPSDAETVRVPSRAPVVIYAAYCETEPAMSTSTPLLDITADLTAPAGESPVDSAATILAAAGQVAVDLYMQRDTFSEFHWEASGLCHKPLYFEERGLERYGHTVCPLAQPLISGAHFFATVPILPYKMTIEPPKQCIYALGYYRPGTCAPRLAYRPPLRLDAAAVQAGVVTGLVFVIP